MELIYPLLVTLVIETPIYFFLLKKKSFLYFIILLIMNVISNLSFNLCYGYLTNNALWFLIIGEIIVFLLETLVIKILKLYGSILKCLIISFICNSASLLVGLILNYIIKISANNNTYFVICIILSIIYLFEFLFIFVLSIIKNRKINDSANNSNTEN